MLENAARENAARVNIAPIAAAPLDAAPVCAAPFDAIADRYDAAFTDHPLGRTLRAAVWRHVDATIAPGARVLDLGCGTGADAVHLASRGIDVTAVDASAAMLAAARRNVAAAGHADRVRLVHGRVEDLGGDLSDESPSTSRKSSVGTLGDITDSPFDPASDPYAIGTGYDAVLSNFGALNCLAPDDLIRLGWDMAGRVRIGGCCIAVLMGPACAWEVVWYLAHGRPRQALRRFRPNGARADVGGGPFVVRYPGVRAIADAFAPSFRLRSAVAINCVLPPTFAGAALDRQPRTLAALAGIDRRVERSRLAIALADHYLVHLERVPCM